MPGWRKSTAAETRARQQGPSSSLGELETICELFDKQSHRKSRAAFIQLPFCTSVVVDYHGLRDPQEIIMDLYVCHVL